MNRHSGWFAVTLALVIMGCTAFPSREPQTVDYHTLLAEEGQPLSPPLDAPILVIPVPAAAPGFGSQRMAYSEQPLHIGFFARNEWVGPLPRLVQPLLSSRLLASGEFGVVVGEVGGTAADWRLDSEILMFLQDFSTSPSYGEVRLRVQLVGRSGIIATATFWEREPAPSEDPRGGVVALNRALRRVSDAVVEFCVAQRDNRIPTLSQPVWRFSDAEPQAHVVKVETHDQ